MIHGTHHLGLTVADVEASADWYVAVLGFTKVADVEEGEGQRRKVVMTHPGLSTRLGLVEHRSRSAGAFDERVAGLDHLSFAVDLEDLESYLERFQQRGVTHSPPQPSLINPAARVVVFRDPDNIQLELYAE